MKVPVPKANGITVMHIDESGNLKEHDAVKKEMFGEEKPHCLMG